MIQGLFEAIITNHRGPSQSVWWMTLSLKQLSCASHSIPFTDLTRDQRRQRLCLCICIAAEVISFTLDCMPLQLPTGRGSIRARPSLHWSHPDGIFNMKWSLTVSHFSLAVLIQRARGRERPYPALSVSLGAIKYVFRPPQSVHCDLCQPWLLFGFGLEVALLSTIKILYDQHKSSIVSSGTRNSLSLYSLRHCITSRAPTAALCRFHLKLHLLSSSWSVIR